jgi:hypothetical protein
MRFDESSVVQFVVRVGSRGVVGKLQSRGAG